MSINLRSFEHPFMSKNLPECFHSYKPLFCEFVLWKQEVPWLPPTLPHFRFNSAPIPVLGLSVLLSDFRTFGFSDFRLQKKCRKYRKDRKYLEVSVLSVAFRNFRSTFGTFGQLSVAFFDFRSTFGTLLSVHQHKWPKVPTLRPTDQVSGCNWARVWHLRWVLWSASSIRFWCKFTHAPKPREKSGPQRKVRAQNESGIRGMWFTEGRINNYESS